MDTSQIKEHMEVKASGGEHVGSVDHLEGTDRIKLAKSDPAAGGKHHFIPIAWIDHVDSHVHLGRTADEVKTLWETEEA